jgi:hypothetical protein
MLDFIGRKLDCSVILLQINVIETISMKIQTSICNRYGSVPCRCSVEKTKVSTQDFLSRAPLQPYAICAKC